MIGTTVWTYPAKMPEKIAGPLLVDMFSSPDPAPMPEFRQRRFMESKENYEHERRMHAFKYVSDVRGNTEMKIMQNNISMHLAMFRWKSMRVPAKVLSHDSSGVMVEVDGAVVTRKTGEFDLHPPKEKSTQSVAQPNTETME